MDQIFSYLNTAPVYVLVAVIAVAGVALYMKMKNKDGSSE